MYLFIFLTAHQILFKIRNVKYAIKLIENWLYKQSSLS